MSFTLELNNVHRDDVVVTDERKFARFCEICSSILAGKDTTKYSKEVDKVVDKIKDMGTRAMSGDTRAMSEINSVVKYVVQPRLLESMKVLNFMGNYHEIGYDELPKVKTYSYDSINARVQAPNSDVSFGTRKWIEYPVATQTISSGMAIDYRELASGNFSGNLAEETAQVQIDMNNNAVAMVLTTIYNALKNNTTGVKFFATYTGDTPTQTAVDSLMTKMRRLGGKTSILADYSQLAAIADFVGFKTVGATTIPFFSNTQVDEIAKTGYIGDYKGSALVEMPNPYNFTKPLADKSTFETYYDTDKIYFTSTGSISPVNIFRRGGITTMTGNDIETGTVKTRFDMEMGADVVKGREFEIGMLAKA